MRAGPSLRGVGKCAATPRRRLSECRKMCGDPSPGTFGVSENARRPLAGDFQGVGKCAATPRLAFSTSQKALGGQSSGLFPQPGTGSGPISNFMVPPRRMSSWVM